MKIANTALPILAVFTIVNCKEKEQVAATQAPASKDVGNMQSKIGMTRDNFEKTTNFSHHVVFIDGPGFTAELYTIDSVDMNIDYKQSPQGKNMDVVVKIEPAALSR